MSFAAIINPAAGGGRCGQRAPSALDELRARGVEVEPFYTRAPGEATRIVKELSAAGRRQFIAVGGDGTSYEILNGLGARLGTSPPAITGACCNRQGLDLDPVGIGRRA